MTVITDLRKIALHPLLVRHHYREEILRQMARDILKDPNHMNSDPNLVYEDMKVMTDFELNNMCAGNKVCYMYMYMWIWCITVCVGIWYVTVCAGNEVCHSVCGE